MKYCLRLVSSFYCHVLCPHGVFQELVPTRTASLRKNPD
ncbi:4Fe-4S binding protein [Pedobacter cryoconitis]